MSPLLLINIHYRLGLRHANQGGVIKQIQLISLDFMLSTNFLDSCCKYGTIEYQPIYLFEDSAQASPM